MEYLVGAEALTDRQLNQPHRTANGKIRKRNKTKTDLLEMYSQGNSLERVITSKTLKPRF